jgi:hypothetical protein
MKPLGSKKTPSHGGSGHQRCGLCHPDPKGGRAYEERTALADVAAEIADAGNGSLAAELRLAECEDAQVDVEIIGGCACARSRTP